MAPNEKVLTRNVGRPEALTVRGYRENGGYEALAKALKSDDPHIALAAAWGLAQVDAPSDDLAAQVVPVLVGGLKSPLPVARQGAAEALARLGPLAKEAAPALEAALDDEEPAVREAIQQALTAVGAK